MESSVGKIIKVFAVIVLVLAIIAGIILLVGDIGYMYDGVRISMTGAWFMALAAWVFGFVEFVFLYAAGTVVENVVAIRKDVERWTGKPGRLADAVVVEEVKDF